MVLGYELLFQVVQEYELLLQVVQEYERAVIFRLGRLLHGGSKGPGENFYRPLEWHSVPACHNWHQHILTSIRCHYVAIRYTQSGGNDDAMWQLGTPRAVVMTMPCGNRYTQSGGNDDAMWQLGTPRAVIMMMPFLRK